MAAIDPDPDLLLAAFLRMVRGLTSSIPEQIQWLTRLSTQALIQNATGIADVLSNLQDFTAAQVGNEGSSTQWVRELSAAMIASLCEAAIQTLEADQAAGGAGKSASGSSRGFCFADRECVLG